MDPIQWVINDIAYFKANKESLDKYLATLVLIYRLRVQRLAIACAPASKAPLQFVR